MRILIVKPSGGAFDWITKGFLNAFNAIGHQARYWDGNLIALESFAPDLYIGCSGHRQEIPNHMRKAMKVAIHVNPFGPKKLELVHGNNINESQNAIDWVSDQKPDAVFGYGHADDASTYWGYWTKNLGVPWVGVATAGDATQYYPDPSAADYDIAYLGGYWPFKGHKIDKWLMPVINEVGVAVMGWGNWGKTKGYRGELPLNDSGRRFLSAAKVGPCITEPHTSIYGIDIPERFFKVALCGVLPISDYVPGFDRYYPKDVYLMASDPAEFKRLVVDYARNPAFADTRPYRADKIRKHTLANHTYFNRMRDLCAAMGMTELVQDFDKKIASLLAN